MLLQPLKRIGRLQIKECKDLNAALRIQKGVHNSTLFVDMWESLDDSILRGFKLLDEQQQHRDAVILLNGYRLDASQAAKLFTHFPQRFKCKWHIIGPLPQTRIPEATYHDNLAAFIASVPLIAFQDKAVYALGLGDPAFFRFEERYQRNSHETVLKVDLAAIEHNLSCFKNELQDNVKVMVMVKAFSYGSGSFEIANFLKYCGVDYLAVAYTDEGIDLRLAHVDLPIMVLNPNRNELGFMPDYNLEPEIYSIDLLKDLIQESNRSKVYRIHLCFDTGMSRLGFSEKNLEELVQLLSANKHITVVSLFTHLAAADDAQKDTFTNDQALQFKRIAEQLEPNLPNKPFLHVLNSAGIQRFQEFQFDYVRLGIGLHGVGAPQGIDSLKYVASLTSVVSQVKHIKPGESVGYGRSFIAKKPTTIATIAIGYGDGISRRLSNGLGAFYINGKPTPIIGNICMDMCMVDITGLEVKRGDEVVIFNSERSIDALAQLLDTIPYEVLTNVSSRVKRLYYLK